MKKILFILAIGFVFSSCNKCVECTTGNEYEVYDSNNGAVEEFGDQIVEICSDNFESKKEFNDYIDALEDADSDIECKSDFWN